MSAVRLQGQVDVHDQEASTGSCQYSLPNTESFFFGVTQKIFLEEIGEKHVCIISVGQKQMDKFARNDTLVLPQAILYFAWNGNEKQICRGNLNATQLTWSTRTITRQGSR